VTIWDCAVLVSMKSIWHIDSMTHRYGNGHGILSHPSDGHHASGIPAIVVKSRTIADAYKLRQEYRTPATLAIFLAEVLTGLSLPCVYWVFHDSGFWPLSGLSCLCCFCPILLAWAVLRALVWQT